MKKLTLMFTLLAFASTATASLSTTYYKTARGLSGYALKTQLSKIITKNHTDRGYKALYSYYKHSDLDRTYDGDGTILDIYSENPRYHDSYNFNPTKSKCGTYKGESDCFNREHLFPQGIFGKRYPMRSDFFHVFPTDGYVNNKRGRLPFGEVKHANWTSKNGSKRGYNSTPGYSGEVFEPIDEFKGDVARAMLYFATRYENKISSWKHPMINGTKHQAYSKWFIKLLIKWHKQDPVSDHERFRNQKGYEFQGNRNPFIDMPELVEKIWVNVK